MRKTILLPGPEDFIVSVNNDVSKKCPKWFTAKWISIPSIDTDLGAWYIPALLINASIRDSFFLKASTKSLIDFKGKAFLSINKALVTQASSAIPVVPLYISLLYKIMKKKNIHEGCIEQMYRLFANRLYDNSNIQLIRTC